MLIMGQNEELYEQSIKSVQTFAETGFLKEALQMLDALEKAFPQNVCEILNLKAEILLICGAKKDALLVWINLLENYDDENAYECIIKNFLELGEDSFDNNYIENIKLLSDYKDVYGEFGTGIKWKIIWFDEDIVIAIDQETRKICGNKIFLLDIEKVKKAPVFIEGALCTKQIEPILEATELETAVNGMGYAVVLAYSDWEWQIFLQINDIKGILESKRIVFVVEKDGLEKCFDDSMMYIPNYAFCLSGREVLFYGFLSEIINRQQELVKDLNESIKAYYEGRKSEIEDRIINRKPRILFWTSRFTTVLQYHSRNAMDAARKLGCECELLIEPDGIRRVTVLKHAQVFDAFKPDVVFMLNHFRYEQPGYTPDNVNWVVWIQDPMPHIMDPANYGRLTKHDILISHFITYEYFKGLYPGRLIDAPVPANHELYKPYMLSEDEIQSYSCDICFVCHASDVDNWVNEFFGRYSMPQEVEVISREFIEDYKTRAIDGDFLYTQDEFQEKIIDKFAEHGLVMHEDGIRILAREMYMWLNQRVFRQCLVDWIIDAGFTNIKLWGNGWQSEPKYADFAMGPAENGETLSKIYQASKVVVGNNIMTTAAARAWESMLSGAFYLSNVIPEGADWCDIHKIMPEGTVEYFHNREELIEKLHFYLEHDDERKRMAELGRQEALKRMTFEALMKRVLDVLPEYLDD